MARISYVASFFMPLVCSSKSYVSLLALLNIAALFALAYVLTQLLAAQYHDPSMFRPNSQDYFRTALLGFFSPFCLYFVKHFMLNLSPRFVLVGLIVDYPVNDLFCLLIVFCLAYPQVQDAHSYSLDDTTWHIIPKQSCVFGISWSLCELLLCLVESIYAYEELPSPESAQRQLELQLRQDEQDSARTDITLSKCVDVKRKSSHISENVYCHDPPDSPPGPASALAPAPAPAPASTPLLDPSYGSIRSDDAAAPESTVVVNFNDNSMSFLRDLETAGSASHSRTRHNPLYSGNIKYFPEITSVRDFLKQLFFSNLVIASNILLTVGQALISSMYFIYVPGHDNLFTSAVIYFGSRTFPFFLLSVVTPFTLLNFLVHLLLFFWKEDTPDSYDPLTKNTSNLDLRVHTSQPQSLQYITSDQLFVVNSIYTQDMLASDEDAGFKILHLFRKFMSTWRAMASHQSFILVGLTLWATSVFIFAIVSTIKH
ncbi:LAFE_0B03906g1_1 [Lachancea fermentati]|uniref:LAFE_0B03906g1_1 n=1 Tax=Lachancea fermentati TaxID=4955 RepID=A0A1G4M7M8_LACFM|nr:LAFE_0B03906g1_1 [Lachancea fermentati]